MNESVTTQKAKLEKRLAEAFPDVWPQLSQDEKQHALDEFHKLVWRRVPAIETVSGIWGMSHNFAIVLIGLVAAVVLGLFVNVIDRLFLSLDLGVAYPIIIIGLAIGSVMAINSIFKDIILEHYRSNDFLNELLKTRPKAEVTEKSTNLIRKFSE